MDRALEAIEEGGNHSGFMFESKNTKTPKIKELEPRFIACLARIQEDNSNAIPKETEVGEEYGVHPSGRRGPTAHARNMGVNKGHIEFYMFWHRTELDMGRSVNTSKMLNYYTEIIQSLPILLRFSGGSKVISAP